MTTPLMDFPYDSNNPLDIRDEAALRTAEGSTVREISFSNALGGRVTATLVTPPGAGPFKPVLWMHWLEPQEHTSNRTQFLPEALTLAKEGVVSLLPDGFWSTDPKRWSSNPTFWWKSDAALDTELSKRQVVEIRRSLDVLLGQPGADASKLLYVGHDFGAMYGILVAAVDRRPKGFVLMAGTTTFSEWFLFGSKLDKQGERQYIKEMSPLDPIKYVSQAAPADLLFQFAHADYYVPERTAHMLYDAASEPKSIRWYDAGHNVQHDQALPDRLEWLRARLGG